MPVEGEFGQFGQCKQNNKCRLSLWLIISIGNNCDSSAQAQMFNDVMEDSFHLVLSSSVLLQQHWCVDCAGFLQERLQSWSVNAPAEGDHVTWQCCKHLSGFIPPFLVPPHVLTSKSGNNYRNKDIYIYIYISLNLHRAASRSTIEQF